MDSLRATKSLAPVSLSKKLDAGHLETIYSQYKSAEKKLLLLDYDGTLVGFRNIPSQASPDPELYALLDTLAADSTTELAIISGRDRATLESWFGHKDYTLITDHGVWLRKKGGEWASLERLKTDWKDKIRPIMESFTDSTPGTFVEEKDYSLAWHYRRADADLGSLRTMELKHVLTALLANNSLSVLEGNKVLEVKSSSVNKGRAAARLTAEDGYDFVLSVGDDWTDEYMFEELPDTAHTIKVGTQKTAARYYSNDTIEVRKILQCLAK